jgi:hypothetical protein
MDGVLVDNSCPSVKTLKGRRLHNRLKRIPLAHRALMACEAEAGSLAFTDLSRAQSSKLLEVSHGYITTVAGLSDDERALLRAQPWLLALKHNRCQREVSNADIDAFISRATPERIFAALDRLTAPQVPLAAE